MLTVNGHTYPAPKLTPPQVNAMWFCAGNRDRSVPSASIRVVRAAGLVDSDCNLTDFGRAWIADQIDQARDEAGNDVRQATDESNQRMRYYRLHHDCTHGYGMAAHVDCDHDQALAEEKRDRDDEAEDAQYRAWVDSHGGPTGRFHQQREMKDVDHAEALEMDRRLDEADIIAARMGFAAHSEAMDEAAERQMAAWRAGHGMGGKPSRSTTAELTGRDLREAQAMDRQRDRDLSNAADAEQIGG